MYGAPESSPDLFHAVPAGIGDPFLYAEVGGRRVAVINVLDAANARATGVEVLDPTELDRDELVAGGAGPTELEVETCLRACHALGVTAAIVPFDFPLAVADHLRAGGIALRTDPDAFAARRRVKTRTQLEGIRRAQRAADAAMGVAATLIRELGDGVTSESVRRAMREACDELGCDLPGDVIVAHGPQSASGHDSGHGPIAAGEPVVVDIWPRDRASRCWADMTRTFAAGGGEPPEELARYWRLTRESLDAASAAVRAGAHGRDVYAASCEPYEAAGLPTQRTKPPGQVLQDGYFHGLGHGVGLEIHERPSLGRLGDELVAGDVITLEPGCYRRGFGGCRLEDLVVVTDAGCEVLTDFPYDL
ncbi:MAG: Xaa-Pro aminopeptidase [Solirubrobacteraceae bacterium]|nr:Xaa-Pro aminopeptidase [Solirubrobacteraceae bacterium]